MDSVQNDEQDKLEETPSPEQWRDLGSAEVNAWTITPPGGQAMSLDEVASYREQEELKRQEHLRIMAAEMESEARIRAAQSQSDNTASDGRVEP